MFNQLTTSLPRLPCRALGRALAAVAMSTLTLLVIPTHASAARVTTDLIAYWPIDQAPIDDGTGIKIFDTVGATRANMTIYPNAGSFTWLPAEGAISLSNLPDGNNDANIGSSGGSGGKIFNNLTSQNAFTAEVWFTPDTVSTPSGYAIIFSYGCHNDTQVRVCTDGSGRYVGNFFIAQRNADVIAGFRSANNLPNANGAIIADPQLQVLSQLQVNVPTHVVITWNGTNKRIELRRENANPDTPWQQTNSDTGTNLADTWTTNQIGLADPQNLNFITKLQQFTGKLYLAAIYNRALAYNDPNDEIRQNYDAGPYPPCNDLDLDGFGSPASAGCADPRLDCNDDPTTGFPINPGATEVCNNIDDNCNNTIDDGVTRSCYTGPAGTQGVGICTGGNQTCTTGKWGACAGEVLPQAEACDALSLDENCNNSSNEGCVCVPNATQPCYTGTPATRGVGICRDGTQTCNAAGTAWGACTGDVLPRAEACANQGTDDDCDSNPNELTDGLNAGSACTAAALGICANGTRSCNAGGAVVCNAPAPGTESCANQGVDNDCDGNLNELTDGVDSGAACGTGLRGICAPGTRACSNATATGVVQCLQTNPVGTETCSNLGTDDNCNNTIDDNFGPELCDGQDNNCQNGLADDGSADLQIKNRETCTPCACGTCVWQCTTTGKQCVSITGSSREQCNGKDDNCNGKTDEGCEIYANRAGNITIGGIPLRYCPFAPK